MSENHDLSTIADGQHSPHVNTAVEGKEFFLVKLYPEPRHVGWGSLYAPPPLQGEEAEFYQGLIRAEFLVRPQILQATARGIMIAGTEVTPDPNRLLPEGSAVLLTSAATHRHEYQVWFLRYTAPDDLEINH